ncbi:FAR1-related sequence 5 [Actinidia rufa]|uniref:FAR1-related sequence 5 n=1 Tax=Actinidia rufa TaxID=165716 RepID=A0A7J0F713_9ERIC|nr:FAR1-related sequence 5 [Actinidia rufa]
MESEVIEFDIGLGGGGGAGSGSGDDDMDGEHPVMDDDMADSSPPGGTFGAIYIPEGDPDLEPYENMEFESEEAAKAFYNSYARRVGFSTRVSSSRRSRKDGAIIQRSFVCAKEGFRNLNEKRTKDREIKRPRTITRVGCKASLSVKIQDSSGKWVVSGFVKEHNHELVPPDQVHCLRSHRQISGPAKTLIDTLQAAGMGPRKIMSALIKEYGGISKVGFTEGDEDQCTDEGAESIDSYNMAMVALQEASQRVAFATKNEGKTSMINGRIREDSTNGGSPANICSDDHPKSISQQFSEDDMDKKIKDLTHELDCANRKCEVYRANLLSVLRDIEDHKQQLSVKVQNVKLSMKDVL